jgi:hypothetical protein
MKRGNFTYSLIRYNHNRLLNESIIIGILFHFQNENKVYVITPNKFTRINSLYSNFNENILKKYLNILDEKANDFNNDNNLQFDKTIDFNHFLNEYFLPKDFSPIQFMDSNKAVLYSCKDKIIEDYKNLYLDEYFKESIISPIKHNEEKVNKENAELKLRLSDVIKSLPDSDEIRIKARELDEKDFDQWWWETVYRDNVL